MRVVLAGMEGRWFREQAIDLQAPSILVSYFYLREQKDGGEQLLRDFKENGTWVLLDSGAFTFKVKYSYRLATVVDGEGRSLDPKAHTQETLDQAKLEAGDPPIEKIAEEVDGYFDGYLEWLKRNVSLVDAFAELDLDELIGDRIWGLRDKLDQAGVTEKAECIITPGTIWDRERIFSGKYTYLGVPGVYGDVVKRMFLDHKQELEEHKIKVHGWAMTKTEAMVKWPFYSMDSTSWLMGGKFGATYRYCGNLKLQSYGQDRKDIRRQLKPDCDEYKIDFEKFLEDNWKAVNRYNMVQWVKCAKDAMEYNVNAYWMSMDERKKVIEKGRSEWRTDTALVRHDYSIDKQRPLDDLDVIKTARFCNTCFLGQKCPLYQEDATCNVTSRPGIKDGKDLQAVLMKLLELQTERVAFGTFVEKVSGIPMDERVAKEMTAMFKMVRELKDISEETANIEIKAKGKGAVSQLLSAFAEKKKERDAAEAEVVNAKPMIRKK